MRYEDARVLMMERNYQLNKFWRKRARGFQEAMATIYDIDLMREALEKVEWEWDDTANASYCPWCNKYKDEGHTPDCLRQRALGLDKKQE